MKRFSKWTLVLVVMAAMTPAAWGQSSKEGQSPPGRPGREGAGPRGGFGRGGGGLGRSIVAIAGEKSVQAELKVSEDQAKSIGELTEKQRGAMQGTRDLSEADRLKKFEEQGAANEKALAEILQPEQFKRLKQIHLQLQGATAFGRPEVAEALQITTEQKEKIHGIQAESRDKLREAFGGGDREEARKKLTELRKSTDEKVLGLLTDEQKSKWQEMTGEPFKGELTGPGFGGGGPRRGNGPPRGEGPGRGEAAKPSTPAAP